MVSDSIMPAKNNCNKSSHQKCLRKNHCHEGKGRADRIINPAEKSGLPPGVALFDSKIVKDAARKVDDGEDVPEKKDIISHRTYKQA